MSKCSPIGFRRVNHVLWAVTDLDQAINLYSELLGGEVIYESRFIDVKKIKVGARGPDYWTDTSNCLGVECHSMAMLRLLDGFRIGLYHVENVFDENVVLFRKKHEINSLTIEVDNIELATKYLMKLGFCVFEVTESIGVEVSCFQYKFFLDPWGNIFKLFVEDKRF